MTGAILGRMRNASWLVVVACVLHGCSDIAPQPSTAPPPLSPTAPFSLSLGTVVGTGANAGHATITAKVQNVGGVPLRDVAVSFTTDVGSLSADSATTAVDGTASATLTASAVATVTVAAGTLTSKTLVVSQPMPPSPPTSTPPPPAPDPAGPSISLLPVTAQIGVSALLQATVRLGTVGARYTWAFGDGSAIESQSYAAAHTYTALGTFTTSVTVVDALGRSASATSTATITPVPPPPPPPAPPAPSYSVTVTAMPTTVLIGGSSTLTATVTLLNGAPPATSFAWDCNGDGVTDVTTAVNSTACVYPTMGTVTSKAMATDGTVSGSASAVVTVTAPPLVVGIVPSTFTPAVGGSVTFTATITSLGPIPAAVEWDWDDTNDGTFEVIIPSAPSPNVRTSSYGASGPHTVRVTIRDLATGRTASGMTTITVP